MKIFEITPTLYLIRLDQEKLPGYTAFINAWLYKGKHAAILIDPGPAATIPMLLESLKYLGIHRLDAILLTHIHIDHAGGIGDIILQFDTPVVCHAAAIPHLKDPSTLWAGSLKILGDTARAYGEIRPVPAGLLHDAADFREYHITPFLTPGHAPHHVSYLIDDCLFAGEAGGVCSEIGAEEIRNQDKIYLRPATPPRFFLETSIQSLEMLMNVSHEILCYGHFGATRKSPLLLGYHKNQLLAWEEMMRHHMQAVPKADMDDYIDMLLKKDPLLAMWHELPAEVQMRERGFLCNSVRGFLQYLEDAS